jgi:hypothetical protein
MRIYFTFRRITNMAEEQKPKKNINHPGREPILGE